MKAQRKKKEREATRCKSLQPKIHVKTTLLLYSLLSPTELSAKLVAEKPCCAGLAASEQQVVEDYRD